ncbi:MAG TPA: hypothetical protein VJY62_22455 [Bacteroidia bacterium]|nr:hypothetical protein [Bacteroidia bacterium]
MRNHILIILFMLQTIYAHAQIDSSATDSVLLKKIEQEMNASQNIPAPAVQQRAAPSANPNISVIGDFRTNYISNEKRHFDANLEETEFSFQSTIDPYAKADFFYATGRNPETGEFSGEIEEGYLTTLSLPAHLQLKAGKFKETMGRVNPVHSHALPFISMPNAYVNYFGDEGLNDEGLSLSWLIPNPHFYQELTVELTDGPRESPSFARSGKDNYLKLAHLKNFWDLSQNTTLELGITGISGENDSTFTTSILAGDLTYKWKPLQMNTYKSFTWQSEFYFSNAKQNELQTVNSIGFYSLINYQLGKRWFATVRYDYSNLPFDKDYRQEAYSLTMGWYATEFQKIEIEGKTTASNVEERNYEALLRWVFVIGSHGAHQY